MRNKLLKLSKFLKQNGFYKLAAEVEDFMKRGGNPLENITKYINEKAKEEEEISGTYMISPGILANVYIKLTDYLEEHKEKYDFIIENHFYDEMIQKLNEAKNALDNTRMYVTKESQKPIEGLQEEEAALDKELKTNIDDELKYIDNMNHIFTFLIELKENEITTEEFSNKVSQTLSRFEKDTEIKGEESDRLKSYRDRRSRIRNRGRSGTLVPPSPTFEVLEGGKTEDDEWKELAEMEIPDDAFPSIGEGDDEEKEAHSAAHGKTYDPETHLYDPEEYPPGFFDD